jgi:hypothetical protein
MTDFRTTDAEVGKFAVGETGKFPDGLAVLAVGGQLAGDRADHFRVPLNSAYAYKLIEDPAAHNESSRNAAMHATRDALGGCRYFTHARQRPRDEMRDRPYFVRVFRLFSVDIRKARPAENR